MSSVVFGWSIFSKVKYLYSFSFSFSVSVVVFLFSVSVVIFLSFFLNITVLIKCWHIFLIFLGVSNLIVLLICVSSKSKIDFTDKPFKNNVISIERLAMSSIVIPIIGIVLSKLIFVINEFLK